MTISHISRIFPRLLDIRSRQLLKSHFPENRSAFGGMLWVFKLNELLSLNEYKHYGLFPLMDKSQVGECRGCLENRILSLL